MNSPHKGQWRGALMSSLICAWMNGWVNNREAGDLRRHRAHYDVTVMFCKISSHREEIWQASQQYRQSISNFQNDTKTSTCNIAASPIFAIWQHVLSLSEQTPYTVRYVPLWRHDMDTRSTLLTLCAGNPADSLHKGPVMWNFDVFFDVSLIMLFIKRSSWSWFGTPCRSYDVTVIPRMMHTICRVGTC